MKYSGRNKMPKQQKCGKTQACKIKQHEDVWIIPLRGSHCWLNFIACFAVCATPWFLQLCL